MKTYGMWTGPSGVDQVALRLSEAGLVNVKAGTETVYFRLPSGRPDTQYEAQNAVDEVYPHADFRVHVYYEE